MPSLRLLHTSERGSTHCYERANEQASRWEGLYAVAANITFGWELAMSEHGKCIKELAIVQSTRCLALGPCKAEINLGVVNPPAVNEPRTRSTELGKVGVVCSCNSSGWLATFTQCVLSLTHATYAVGHLIVWSCRTDSSSQISFAV